MSAREAVGVSGSGQVSDEGGLRVGLVLVRPGPVSGVEANEGRGTALTLGRVPASLKQKKNTDHKCLKQDL